MLKLQYYSCETFIRLYFNDTLKNKTKLSFFTSLRAHFRLFLNLFLRLKFLKTPNKFWFAFQPQFFLLAHQCCSVLTVLVTEVTQKCYIVSFSESWPSIAFLTEIFSSWRSRELRDLFSKRTANRRKLWKRAHLNFYLFPMGSM